MTAPPSPTPAPSPVVEDGFPHLCRPPLDHSWVRTDDGGRRCASCKRYEGPTPPAALEEELRRLADTCEIGELWKQYPQEGMARLIRSAAVEIARLKQQVADWRRDAIRWSEKFDVMRRQAEGAEAHLTEIVEAAGPFLVRDEPWMAEWPDETPMSHFARVTFGQYRRLRAALTPEDRHG